MAGEAGGGEGHRGWGGDPWPLHLLLPLRGLPRQASRPAPAVGPGDPQPDPVRLAARLQEPPSSRRVLRGPLPGFPPPAAPGLCPLTTEPPGSAPDSSRPTPPCPTGGPPPCASPRAPVGADPGDSPGPPGLQGPRPEEGAGPGRLLPLPPGQPRSAGDVHRGRRTLGGRLPASPRRLQGMRPGGAGERAQGAGGAGGRARSQQEAGQRRGPAPTGHRRTGPSALWVNPPPHPGGTGLPGSPWDRRAGALRAGEEGARRATDKPLPAGGGRTAPRPGVGGLLLARPGPWSPRGSAQPPGGQADAGGQRELSPNCWWPRSFPITANDEFSYVKSFTSSQVMHLTSSLDSKSLNYLSLH